jgi:hypothetical protein
MLRHNGGWESNYDCKRVIVKSNIVIINCEQQIKNYQGIINHLFLHDLLAIFFCGESLSIMSLRDKLLIVTQLGPSDTWTADPAGTICGDLL